MQSRFRVFTTRFGHAGIVATGRGLRRVYLPERSKAGVKRRVKSEFGGASEDGALLPKLVDALVHYFDGRRVDFHVRLDCDDASDFQVAVWRVCRRVRYGKTVSYGELAARAGRSGAARAVGTVMSRNPFPIVVPCHRVLRSGGSLGGYSGLGGIESKRRLLAMEAAAARPERRT